MEKLKLFIDSVWVENKDPFVIGVAMRNEDGHQRLSFHAPKADYEKYRLGDVFKVSIEHI